ncbi:MAG TPA: 6,7-dimethyl-8-ribityllumazine synthase [Terriglobales bacterium]|nr:6,7-dimethyl-8-ribityllumazine synthase [Terriglobales bacterium]
MIRSFHKLLVAANDKEFSVLVDFFDSLGLARGEAWEGRRSKGIKLDAREAGVEIGAGKGFPDADLVIECASADVLYDIAKKRKLRITEEIADTEWGARMFSVEVPARKGRLAIFSYKEDWRKGPAKKLGELNAAGKRFGIVVSRFNAFITERLLGGALDALKRTGARDGDITVVRVPGSFEVPLAARKLAETGADAVICLACIIRGETSHYEHLAEEVTRGIGQSAQETRVPHAYGVLTCDNLEQAIDRAGLKMGNKGFEAALSAVEMAFLQSSVAGRQSPAKTKPPRVRPVPGRRLNEPRRKKR